jgi:RimJ/RimL family protein N-acetyltransferase
MDTKYSLRQFVPADWQHYKAIRLEALEKEPGVFCASYAEQSAFPDEHWQQRLSDDRFAYFGLYCEDELIGMSGIACIAGNDEEAELIASYIKQAHRGIGLSGLFYQARIDWAYSRRLKRLFVSHRASNIASKRANQNFGFLFTHSVPRVWPDGAWENNLYYELILE